MSTQTHEQQVAAFWQGESYIFQVGQTVEYSWSTDGDEVLTIVDRMLTNDGDSIYKLEELGIYVREQTLIPILPFAYRGYIIEHAPAAARALRFQFAKVDSEHAHHVRTFEEAIETINILIYECTDY